jgi:hypothetical protein
MRVTLEQLPSLPVQLKINPDQSAVLKIPDVRQCQAFDPRHLKGK